MDFRGSMDFNDIINTQIKPCIEQFIDKRQSFCVVGENVGLVYKMSGWGVIISEEKELPWHLGTIQHDKVRATFDTKYFHWNLYYRKDKKWLSYSNKPIADFLEVMRIVEQDEHRCFFG